MIVHTLIHDGWYQAGYDLKNMFFKAIEAKRKYFIPSDLELIIGPDCDITNPIVLVGASEICIFAGHLSSTTGVSLAAQRYLDVLKKLTYDVIQIDISTNSQWIEDIARHMARQKIKFVIIALNANQFSVEARLKHVVLNYIQQNTYTIGIWAWESDLPSDDFIDASLYLDEIWSISHYMNRSLKDLGVKTNVLSIPVDPKYYPANGSFEEFDALRLKYKFLVGYMFDLRSFVYRKNPQGVIAAFKKAFSNNQDVALILKISGTSEYPDEFEQIKELVKDINAHIFADNWSAEKITHFYLMIDVYLALFRNEGFGLTISEAMLFGKPVICPFYSGVEDFALKDERLNVAFIEQSLKVSWGPYKKGMNWIDPDVEDSSKKLYTLYKTPELYGVLSNLSKQKIQSALSIDVVSSQMSQILSHVESKITQ